MKRFKEYFMCFAVGAVAYGFVELCVRGYTHWTMALTGGCVLLLFNLINRTEKISFFLKCLLGMIVITSLEFAVGMTVNIGLNWNVWDYSDKPFNLFGQICPQFCVAWFFISIPAYRICDYIQKRINCG